MKKNIALMALLFSLASHAFGMDNELRRIKGRAQNVLQEGVHAQELYRDAESSVWHFHHFYPLPLFSGYGITSSSVDETNCELVEAYLASRSCEGKEAWSDARKFGEVLKKRAKRGETSLNALLAETPDTPYHRYFLQQAGISTALGFAALKEQHAHKRRAENTELDKELERQQLALAGVDYATNPAALQRLHEVKLLSPTKKFKVRSALINSGEPAPALRLSFKENREGDEDIDFS